MRAIPSIIRIINRQVLFRGSAYATTVSFGVMVYDCITLSKQNAVTSQLVGGFTVPDSLE